VSPFRGEIERRTSGALKATIYPSSSLMKTNAQFSAMRKGALDLSLVPAVHMPARGAGDQSCLMPGVVTSYEQGASWKRAAIGKALATCCTRRESWC